MTQATATSAKPWRDKANRIIAALCLKSYRERNPQPGKRHRAYIVPSLAQSLVNCLNRDDELEAKSLFLSYEGLEALSL